MELRELSAVGRSFYERDARQVAPDLLNKIFIAPGGVSGRIVEVEAYLGADDPAAHSFRGQTRRNATMFGAPGHMYVYFTYGMHWCANAVCGDVGVGEGVLIRALEPLTGLDQMRVLRPRASRDQALCNGPAKLAQALGITGKDDGADLVAGDQGFRIMHDLMRPPIPPGVSNRIGISKAVDMPWRWFVPGNPNVSR